MKKDVRYIVDEGLIQMINKRNGKLTKQVLSDVGPLYVETP